METKTTQTPSIKLFLIVYVAFAIPTMCYLFWLLKDNRLAHVFFNASWPFIVAIFATVGIACLLIASKLIPLKAILIGNFFALIGIATFGFQTFQALPNEVQEWYWQTSKRNALGAVALVIASLIFVYCYRRLTPVKGAQA